VLPEPQKSRTPKEEQNVSELMSLILPVSEHQVGMLNEVVYHQKLQRYELENIRAPALVLDSKDVSTFPGSKHLVIRRFTLRYPAQKLKFVGDGHKFDLKEGLELLGIGVIHSVS
jgi:hypothetical protein